MTVQSCALLLHLGALVSIVMAVVHPSSSVYDMVPITDAVDDLELATFSIERAPLTPSFTRCTISRSGRIALISLAACAFINGAIPLIAGSDRRASPAAPLFLSPSVSSPQPVHREPSTRNGIATTLNLLRKKSINDAERLYAERTAAFAYQDHVIKVLVDYVLMALACYATVSIVWSGIMFVMYWDHFIQFRDRWENKEVALRNVNDLYLGSDPTGISPSPIRFKFHEGLLDNFRLFVQIRSSDDDVGLGTSFEGGGLTWKSTYHNDLVEFQFSGIRQRSGEAMLHMFSIRHTTHAWIISDYETTPLANP